MKYSECFDFFRQNDEIKMEWQCANDDFMIQKVAEDKNSYGKLLIY